MLPYQSVSRKEDGIAIIGLGGAGANILQCFGGSSADNVRLAIVSLDERVGRACGNVEFIQLGSGLNRGLGSGGDPEVGAHAAQESRERLAELLHHSRLLVMVAGLGGGTGSGAAPVLAQMARDAGLFLVSVLVMPFSFEGHRRREQAERALESVSALSDIVFCFENDYMEDLFRNRSGARAVFEEVDRLLAKATAAVPMLANSPGLINLGLDELAVALENNDSRCIFGSGSGYGAHRAEDAARAAIESPLVSYHNALRFARTVIVHIAGGDSMSLTEIRRCMELVHESLADGEVRLFFGTTVKPKLGDEIRVTLIASINGQEMKAAALEEEKAAPEVHRPLTEPQVPLAEEDEDIAPGEDTDELPEDDNALPAPEDELFEVEEDERLAPLPAGVPEPDANIAPEKEPLEDETEGSPAPSPRPAPAPSPTRAFLPEDEDDAFFAPPPPRRAPLQGQLFQTEFIPADDDLAADSSRYAPPSRPSPRPSSYRSPNDMRDLF